MREFCTYFDSFYVPRALALLSSLRLHCSPFRLWALCMDEECHSFISGLSDPFIKAVRLADLEAFDPELAAVKGARNRIEYYFTCTPAFITFVMAAVPAPREVTYLDADMFFFSSAEPVFEEMAGASVVIIPHRFPPNLRERSVYGTYNVGWLTFRDHSDGPAVLRDWRQKCIEWCFDRLEEKRYADQKYLDDWPQRFRGVHVVRHPGANLAPWNIGNHSVTHADGRVSVDRSPLLFYHFHGLRRLTRKTYDSGLGSYRVRMEPGVRDGIYRPYIKALFAEYARISAAGFKRLDFSGVKGNGGVSLLRRLYRTAGRTYSLMTRALLSGNLVRVSEE